jgi:PTS system sucrose-specific IIC component
VDDRALAAELLRLLGGPGNVASFANCMTRLRVTVADVSAVERDAILATPGVLGLVPGETTQIVLGPGRVTKVSEQFGVALGAQNDVDVAIRMKAAVTARQTSRLQAALRDIGAIFVPLIPGFVASGLILGVTNVIANLAKAGDIPASVVDGDWFRLLSATGGLLFAVLGVFVGINAAKQYGGTPVLGGIAGLLVYSPILRAEPDGIAPLDIFGVQLPIAPGLGGVLGVIFAAWLWARIERAVRSRTPDSLDLLITPLVTVVVGGFLTVLVIMPIAGEVMKAVTWFLVDVGLDRAGVVGGFVLAATFLPLVLLGLHQGLTPVHLQLIADYGRSDLLPVLACGGAGQVGCAAAIWTMTRDQDLRNRIAGALPVGILGIGEPLIFGVTLPLGRPFVAACVGAGFGGVWMALYDIGSVAFGPSGAALIPLIADGKYLLYIVGLLISYGAGFLITRFWGFNESMVARLDRGPDHGDDPAAPGPGQPDSMP